ncbi:MAG: hypothetical protein KatS3mg035_1660 [Bacteroidia bacterium]|nr:MAG: hypothetical protein KatS3mg035_1660 [Bacteroidia bacterium]
MKKNWGLAIILLLFWSGFYFEYDKKSEVITENKKNFIMEFNGFR